MTTILKKIRREEHPYCLLCGRNNPRGLKLDFQFMENGTMETSLRCSKGLEGYRGIVHGGVIAALLDSIMTNCLFANGVKALTAELKVRYLSSVNTKELIRLRAVIEKSYAHFFMLKAELFQNGTAKARATGKFFSFSQKQSHGPNTSKKIKPTCK